MRVNRAGETVVEEIRLLYHAAGKVDRLHHAPGGQNLEHSVEVGIVLLVSCLEGLGELGAAARVDLEALMLAGLDQRVEVHLGRFRMTTQHCALREVFDYLFGYRDVRQQHELFHHGIRLAHLLRFDVNRIVSLAVHLEADLWRC